MASALLTHGRLGLPQILRLTKLKPRIVRASILVLVQHNLLWHAQSDDEGQVFEINVEECLMRLRYGRYVWLAGQLYGEAVRRCPIRAYASTYTSFQGADIVQLVLDHGKLRPPVMVSRLSIYDPIKGTLPYT